MNFEEKTVKSTKIFEGRILTLRHDDVVLPDGKPAKREVVDHSGGACVLAERDGKILLIRQFRYPYKEITLEIPAGKLNVGENPATTAIRELEEEAGVLADGVELMFEVYPSPGYTSEKIYIYKANGLKDTNVHPDDGEFVSGEWYDKPTLKKMIDNGEIKDGKTLIALLRVL